MAYSIKKVLEVKVDPNYTDDRMVAIFIFNNGSHDRKCIYGGLPNNQNDAVAKILDNAEMIYSKGQPYQESTINITCPQKNILDQFPSRTQALNACDGISNLAEAKAYLRKLTIGFYEVLDILVK